MPLLYYWRSDNYRRDLARGPAYHLNQSTPLLERIERGDSLWAFTRNLRGHYAFAAELVVQATTRNPPGYEYGPYRVWGSWPHSRYFDIDAQPDAETIIRALSVRTEARLLGQSFQGHAAVREITQMDHALLQAATQDLPHIQTVNHSSESILEELVHLGRDDALAHFFEELPLAWAEERVRYLTQAPRRSRALVEQLREEYEGRCQLCEYAPRDIYDADTCEAHHIHWLSRGGEDELRNMMLLCPNHHRAVHAVDAAFDYGSSSLLFPTGAEELRLNHHL